MNAPSTTATTQPGSRLRADGLTLSYGRAGAAPAVTDVDLLVPDGRTTAVVGPNGCGKSTLLRGLARLLRPADGTVLLDGRDIARRPTKEVARVLGLMPQSPLAPEGITVVDLVGRGRGPHHGALHRWSTHDEAVVAEALAVTGTLDLADRVVDELSGGQRQRVWVAMALAQQTDLLLLDEPTTFLDVCHQLDVLDLLDTLGADRGTTIVMVLHDLNLAARYADHLVAMKDGRIVTEGPPSAVVTEDRVSEVFGLDCLVVTDPVTHTPLVVPRGRSRHRGTVARSGGCRSTTDSSFIAPNPPEGLR